jgi:transposase
MTKQRRHFSGPEKVAALKRHLVEKVPVSDLCDELGIAPNLFYRWQKEFFDNGHTAFDNGLKAKTVEDAKDKKIEQLPVQNLTIRRANNLQGYKPPREREKKACLSPCPNGSAS